MSSPPDATTIVPATQVEVFLRGRSVRRLFVASRATLLFEADSTWARAQWQIGDSDVEFFPAPEVEQIGALGGSIGVDVVNGEGARFGPFTAEAVMTGYPHGALCFIFRQTEVGYWQGVTVALSFGKVVVVPYEFDPM